ncbi:MAG: CehA/McbA family metallohydrolase [Planctomycetes bacterium]|jgi:hypothetical protein|nr:CehA/McbA family metallohydrolase [Planctomycetota bacterium]MCP4839773.1 CehA/McbA family metallohydrolase [Planctomycetota bacterium]
MSDQLAWSLVASVAVAGSAMAHDHEPDWLESVGQIYVEIGGASSVRGKGQAWGDIRIVNLSDEPASLIRVELARDGHVYEVNDLVAPLPAVGKAGRTYAELDALLGDLVSAATGEVEQLLDSQARALEDVHAASVSRRLYPGSDLTGEWAITITLDCEEGCDTHVYPIDFQRHPLLPNGTAAATRLHFDAEHDVWVNFPPRSGTGEVWSAGDQHLHTTWSLDAYALEGTEEGPAGYADTARSYGLDWIMITDHSNIHAWYFGTWFFTPEQHEIARQEAADYRSSEDWPLLYSQEMGLGRTGFWDLASHMLVYPLDTFDAPYLENPSSGLIFGHAECEDEQVIIDRINNNGCYGFIAHPYEEGTLSFAKWNWDNGATGWAGLELWSNAASEFHESDLSALNKWHDLLGGIAAPTNGSLADRAGFPTPFPVGIGNSDAHTSGAIGNVFTYARLDEVTPSTLREAFLAGRCVASDGPLVTIDVNTAGIGDVAILPDGRGRVVVRLETNSQFGPVSDYNFVLQADGETLMELPTGDIAGYAAEFVIDSSTMFADVTYLTAWAQRSDLDRLALTNPVWLQNAAAGDVDGDGEVGVNDLLAMLASWGVCEGCPADSDGSGVVDVNDILTLLANWSA